jgi:catechol 2,3-dioxygenase-like lactoylglutathione lyase family enzyme
MIRYVTLGADDLDAAARFYDAALAPLGLVRLVTRDNEIGYGRRAADGEPGTSRLWILRPFDGGRASFGNGVDVAFDAPSRAAVDAFHAGALLAGGTDEGAPGLRPNYSPTFYTAYVRDPVGNKLNAVFDGPA